MQGEITLKQYRKNNVLKTLLRRFFFSFYTCVTSLCFWTNILLLRLQLDFHLVTQGVDTFVTVLQDKNANHFSVQVLLFLYVCPKVVLLNNSNFALVAFRLHLVAEVLLFLYVYPHEVSLDLSNDAPFAFLIIIFCHTGDTFEAVESRRSNSDHSEARL